MSSAAAAVAWLDQLAPAAPLAEDEAIAEGLDQLIQQLRPVTPVRTGQMQADYAIATVATGREWELIDTAESPAGYPYPARVFGEPGFSRQYDALHDVLDAGELALARDLDVAITRIMGRL